MTVSKTPGRSGACTLVNNSTRTRSHLVEKTALRFEDVDVLVQQIFALHARAAREGTKTDEDIDAFECNLVKV